MNLDAIKKEENGSGGGNYLALLFSMLCTSLYFIYYTSPLLCKLELTLHIKKLIKCKDPVKIVELQMLERNSWNFRENPLACN